MPIESTQKEGTLEPRQSANKEREEGQETVKFDKSPLTSTYLVACVVGEFEYIEDTTKVGQRILLRYSILAQEGIVMRCYTTAGKKEQGRFALTVAVKAMTQLAERFGTHSPQYTARLITKCTT